jgi:hypothetical protein
MRCLAPAVARQSARAMSVYAPPDTWSVRTQSGGMVKVRLESLERHLRQQRLEKLAATGAVSEARVALSVPWASDSEGASGPDAAQEYRNMEAFLESRPKVYKKRTKALLRTNRAEHHAALDATLVAADDRFRATKKHLAQTTERLDMLQALRALWPTGNGGSEAYRQFLRRPADA